jgi:hypothetical protein
MSPITITIAAPGKERPVARNQIPALPAPAA